MIQIFTLIPFPDFKFINIKPICFQRREKEKLDMCSEIMKTKSLSTVYRHYRNNGDLKA